MLPFFFFFNLFIKTATLHLTPSISKLVIWSVLSWVAFLGLSCVSDLLLGWLWAGWSRVAWAETAPLFIWDSLISCISRRPAYPCPHSGRSLKDRVTCRTSWDLGLEMGHCHSIKFSSPGHPRFRDEEKASTFCWEELKIILKRTWIQKVVRILCHFCKLPNLPLAKKMVFRSILKKLILVEGSNLANTTFK